MPSLTAAPLSSAVAFVDAAWQGIRMTSEDAEKLQRVLIQLGQANGPCAADSVFKYHAALSRADLAFQQAMAWDRSAAERDAMLTVALRMCIASATLAQQCQGEADAKLIADRGLAAYAEYVQAKIHLQLGAAHEAYVAVQRALALQKKHKARRKPGGGSVLKIALPLLKARVSAELARSHLVPSDGRQVLA